MPDRLSVLEPDELKIASAAFERTIEALARRSGQEPDEKQQKAIVDCLLQRMSEGENDPERLHHDCVEYLNGHSVSGA